MAKRLSMRKIAEVLRLHHECLSSQRDIALAVGVSPTTVSEYVRRAKSAGIGYPLPAGMDEAALQTKLFPVRSAIKSAPPDPDWAIIHQELARKHVTLTQLRFTLLTVTSSQRRDLHPQVCAHAGRTKKPSRLKDQDGGLRRNQRFAGVKQASSETCEPQVSWRCCNTQDGLIKSLTVASGRYRNKGFPVVARKPWCA